MTLPDDVHDAIEARFDQAVETLETLVAQPSVSTTGRGIEASADLVRETMERLGLEAEIVPTDGHPAVLAEAGPDDPEGAVLFYGHHDVQPPGPAEAWTTPPFEPSIRDGRMYGRGTADNKGQFLAHAVAVRALLDARGELPRRVVLLVEGEEEVGSPHLADLCGARAHRLRATGCFTADGPMHPSGRPTVYLGFRGILYVILRCRTAAEDVHSGNWGGAVPNPAWRLIECLTALRGPDGEVRIPDFEAEVREPTSEELALAAQAAFPVEAVRDDFGLDRLEAPTGEAVAERTMFRPTFNLNGLRSGHVGSGTKTIIPAEAEAKVDIRLVPDQDPIRILERLRGFCAEHFPDVEVEFHHAMHPYRMAPSQPVARAAVRAIETGFGTEPLVVPALGGSVPLATFRDLDLPVVLVPYSYPDDRIHAPDENIRLDAFRAGVRSSASVILEGLG